MNVFHTERLRYFDYVDVELEAESDNSWKYFVLLVKGKIYLQ